MQARGRTMTERFDRSGCFRTVVDVFQIISAVAGVVGVLVTIFIFIYTIRHPGIIDKVATALASTGVPTESPGPTVTPSPTSTLSLTPTSMPTAKPTITASPTFTPIPTDTPTATVSPTSTPTPTKTPTATASPVPTPTAPVLTVGDEWSDNRVTLKMTQRTFSTNWGVGFVSYKYVVGFAFEFENHSGETIVLRYDTENFFMRDNRDRSYSCSFRDGSSHFTRDPIAIPVSNTDRLTFLVGCGRDQQFDKDVAYIVFSIRDFSSLGSSDWQIEVPK